MYCAKCGAKQATNAQFCSECGNSLNKETVETKQVVNEGSTFGWGVLGFFIPLVGLILFLVWKKDRPKASKSSGIGALSGFITWLVFYIFVFVLMFVVFDGSITDAIRTNIYY